tara:strand:+ start:51 stop:1709 length:1659 start_codon:yes stop_codon:yes gene_type:complete
MTPEEVELARKLRLENVSLKDIAKQLNTSESSISRVTSDLSTKKGRRLWTQDEYVRLEGLVDQLKKKGNWPPKGGLSYLGKTIVNVGEEARHPTGVRKAMEELGLDLSWVQMGSSTAEHKIAKEKLKKLINSPDYPKDLDEIGELIGIDNRPTLSRWIRALGVEPRDWPSGNVKWSDAKWDKWEADKLAELEGNLPPEKIYGVKGEVSFTEKFNSATEAAKKRYLDAVKNHDDIPLEGELYSEYRRARSNINERYLHLQNIIRADNLSSLDDLLPEEIEKVIQGRGYHNYKNLLRRAEVYGYDTAELPEGGRSNSVKDIIKDTKKRIGTTLFAGADDLEKMREMAVQAVREQVEGYLKTGEATPIRHMGHIVPYGSPVVLNPGTEFETMHGGWVDSPIKKEATVGGVGTTTVGNLELQDDFANRSQKNVLTQAQQADVNETHRKWMKSKGYGIGIGTFLGLLLAGHSEKGFTMDQFGKTVKDPWYWGDIFSGLDSRGFAKGMQEEYKEFTGDTYTEDWNKSKEFWGSIPNKMMGLLKPEEKKKREERQSIWT